MPSRAQVRNAAIIAAVGRQLGASQRDILIAIMVARQESGLRNLTYGHLDSVGLFQQRNAWGSYGQRTNPYSSARMFFTGGHAGQPGLFDIGNRYNMSLTLAGQAVQRSAFPYAYAQHEDEARQLLGMSVGPGHIPTARASVGDFIRPVTGGRITQRFGDPEPRGIDYARGFKNGISFAGPAGTPVYAAGGGTVVRTSSGGAYGNRVEIEHNGKIWTLYAHLARAVVSPGDTVRAGQMIGFMGSTGQSTGSHLHFELRTGENDYYSAVNPMPYLSQNTTPSAYIRDLTFETIVPGVFDTEEFDDLVGPVSAAFQTKPYVYINPFEDVRSSLMQLPAGNPFGSTLSEGEGPHLMPQGEQTASVSPQVVGEQEVV